MPIVLPTPTEFSGLPLQTRRRVLSGAMQVLQDYGHPVRPVPMAHPSQKRGLRWSHQDGEAVRREAERIYLATPPDPHWREHQAAIA
jgi:hypothetical protein